VTEESTRSAASQVSRINQASQVNPIGQVGQVSAANSLNNAFSIQSSGRTYGARNLTEGHDDDAEQHKRGQLATTVGRDAAASHNQTAQAEAAVPAERAARLGAPAPSSTADRDEVTIKMPADGVYLSVLRTATAGLAARLDFTLDEIEDMRIAVDEACAMLLSQAIPGSNLECRFSLGLDAMTIFVSVRCVEPRVPAGDTFAWTVLTALAGRVDAEVGPGDLLTFVLRKSRDTSRSV
jgi:serine/threonine-protein kinase RsbW